MHIKADKSLRAYYNEIDPYAAAWLRNLIAAGHIAPGDVDERSIEDVYPDDLRGYTQCHFFAGIGVWSYALRQAGWPDDRPVWTGSCPCQPYSAAGKGAGFADERHLWPAFFHLIQECKPALVFGEQVASKDANPWIDLVQNDLEAVGYGVGAIAFPAAGIGAPHIRDRLYWVADASGQGLEKRKRFSGVPGWKACAVKGQATERGSVCATGGMANSEGAGKLGVIRDARGESAVELRSQQERVKYDCGGELGKLAHTDSEQYYRGRNIGRELAAGLEGCAIPNSISTALRINRPELLPGPTNGFWRNADWLACRDGRWRPTEPGACPLVDGATARVGRLRAYGNAIVAPQAQAFIEAVMQTD